jgi:riboflavin synthase
MFSGIVHSCCQVTRIQRSLSKVELEIELGEEVITKLHLGCSVAINGVCLTVTAMSNGLVTFDVINETMRVTNLKNLQRHDRVNIELSLSTQADISGHIVSGHIDGLATVINIERSSADNKQDSYSLNNQTMNLILQTPPVLTKYIFTKGFITLNGCSLTVGHVDRHNNTFAIYLIPETLRRTNLSLITEGSELNLEVEKTTQAIVDTVHDFLNKIQPRLCTTNGAGLSQAEVEEILSKHILHSQETQSKFDPIKD